MRLAWWAISGACFVALAAMVTIVAVQARLSLEPSAPRDRDIRPAVSADYPIGETFDDFIEAYPPDFTDSTDKDTPRPPIASRTAVYKWESITIWAFDRRISGNVAESVSVLISRVANGEDLEKETERMRRSMSQFGPPGRQDWVVCFVVDTAAKNRIRPDLAMRRLSVRAGR